MPLFFNQLKAIKNFRYYYLAVCQYFLGLRIGEAAGLHWQDCDQENLVWRIEKVISWANSSQSGFVKSLPKNDEVREQPFSKVFASEMELFRRLTGGQKEGLVFHLKGRPLRRNTIVLAYNKALQKADLGHLSGSHFMRRTSGTLGHNRTKDFAAASHFLGHADVSESNRYIGRDGWKESHLTALEEVFNNVGADSVETEKLKLVR